MCFAVATAIEKVSPQLPDSAAPGRSGTLLISLQRGANNLNRAAAKTILL